MAKIKDNSEKGKRNREYQRKWFAANKEKQQARITANNKRRKEEVRALVNEAKKSGCTKCPEKHKACLDFHHVNPKEKLFNISQEITHGFALQRYVDEIEKCIILCSNCHKKLHWDEKHDGD